MIVCCWLFPNRDCKACMDFVWRGNAIESASHETWNKCIDKTNAKKATDLLQVVNFTDNLSTSGLRWPR